MQQRISDWVNGKTQLADQNLWLSETGEIARLGLNDKVFEDVYFLFYNLGFMILEDKQSKPYLVNIAGFEDRAGKRFTYPFHNGELYAPYETLILKEFQGRKINRGIQIFYDKLTPLQFVKEHYGGLENFVTMGSTIIGPADRPEYRADFFLRESEETTQALTEFLGCAECSIDNMPETIKKYANQIPILFDSKMPYLWIYSVNYW
jgi:hypothetical protein